MRDIWVSEREDHNIHFGTIVSLFLKHGETRFPTTDKDDSQHLLECSLYAWSPQPFTHINSLNRNRDFVSQELLLISLFYI